MMLDFASTPYQPHFFAIQIWCEIGIWLFEQFRPTLPKQVSLFDFCPRRPLRTLIVPQTRRWLEHQLVPSGASPQAKVGIVIIHWKIGVKAIQLLKDITADHQAVTRYCRYIAS